MSGVPAIASIWFLIVSSFAVPKAKSADWVAILLINAGIFNRVKNAQHDDFKIKGWFKKKSRLFLGLGSKIEWKFNLLYKA